MSGIALIRRLKDAAIAAAAHPNLSITLTPQGLRVASQAFGAGDRIVSMAQTISYQDVVLAGDEPGRNLLIPMVEFVAKTAREHRGPVMPPEVASE